MPGTSLTPDLGRLIQDLIARVERMERKTAMPTDSATDILWKVEGGTLQPVSSSYGVAIVSVSGVEVASTASSLILGSAGPMTISGVDDVNVTAGNTIQVEGSTVDVEADNITLNAGTQIELSGPLLFDQASIAGSVNTVVGAIEVIGAVAGFIPIYASTA